MTIMRGNCGTEARQSRSGQGIGSKWTMVALAAIHRTIQAVINQNVGMAENTLVIPMATFWLKLLAALSAAISTLTLCASCRYGLLWNRLRVLCSGFG